MLELFHYTVLIKKKLFFVVKQVKIQLKTNIRDKGEYSNLLSSWLLPWSCCSLQKQKYRIGSQANAGQTRQTMKVIKVKLVHELPTFNIYIILNGKHYVNKTNSNLLTKTKLWITFRSTFQYTIKKSILITNIRL